MHGAGPSKRVPPGCGAAFSQTIEDLPFLVSLSAYQPVGSFINQLLVDNRDQKQQITLNFNQHLDPWIRENNAPAHA